MFLQEGGVDGCLLLGGIGVEFAAHILKPAENMVRLPVGCPLEEHMLNEVCHAVFFGELIA